MNRWLRKLILGSSSICLWAAFVIPPDLQKALTEHEKATGEAIVLQTHPDMNDSNAFEVLETISNQVFTDQRERQENSILILIQPNQNESFARVGLRMESRISANQVRAIFDENNQDIYSSMATILEILESPVFLAIPNKNSPITKNVTVKTPSSGVSEFWMILFFGMGVLVFGFILYLIMAKESAISEEGQSRLGPVWQIKLLIHGFTHQKQIKSIQSQVNHEW